MFHDQIEADRARLLETYHQLADEPKVIIQICAVIYEAADADDIEACLQKLPKKLNRMNVPTSGLAKHLKILTKGKLLERTKNRKLRCSSRVVEPIMRELSQTKQFKRVINAVEQGMPMTEHWRGGPMPRSFDQLLRAARIGLYTHNFQYIQMVLDNTPLVALGHSDDVVDLLMDVINNPFDVEWFETLPPPFQFRVLESLIQESVFECTNIDPLLNVLEDLVDANPSHEELTHLLLSQFLLRGRFAEAKMLCELHSDTYHKHCYLGCLAAIEGDANAACEYFRASLKLKQNTTNQRPVYLEGMAGLWLFAAGVRANQGQWVQQQMTNMKQGEHLFADVFELFEIVLAYHSGNLAKGAEVREFEVLPLDAGYVIDSLFMAMGWFWVFPQEAKQFVPMLAEMLDAAIAAHYDWLAIEIAHLLHQLKPSGQYLKQVQSLPAFDLVVPVVDIIQAAEPWELCLSALTTLNQPNSVMPGQIQRLVWFLAINGNHWELTPKEQKITAKGSWSKGRAIALKRLARSAAELDYLTEQDRRICNCIESEQEERYRYYYSPAPQYEFNQQAIAELVGHPLVFWEDAPDVKVEVVAGEPEILVRQESPDSLRIELSPPLQEEEYYLLQKETLTRVKMIAVQPEHHSIAKILGVNNCLKVPVEAKERVLEAINSISTLVTVQSDIGGGNEAIPEVPSSATPHLQLFPLNAGLNLKLLIRPFDQMGPYFAPGKGGQTVISEIEGVRTLTVRDLSAEAEQAQVVIDSCPVLREIPPENFEWILNDPEDCLEVLLTAQSLADHLVIEWPEGESFTLKPMVSLSNFNMSLTRQRDWFAVSGEVQLEEDEVLSLQQLMALLNQAKGRFIPMGEGQFFALTDTFRKRLEELRAISEQHGQNMRLNPLASLALEDWVDEVGSLKTDKHWKQHIKRLKQVRTLEPQIPSTLQAELRDYQIDGFKWLARLSAWGVGACLADDMGLGKTLQAIALILTRAPQGPTLVVAPTSVGMNWITEAQRFAPTLNPIQFGTLPTDQRQQAVDALQPFDLLICTYGLLQRPEVAKMLAEVEWQVIVLDEAQAIKNSTTKRSKAAMKLQGEFKILTTGTPIENHLGELWNLFRFITPGLLGSLEQFNTRFAHPIEREDSPMARQQLRKVIQPFILRRTKTEVLDELPSRTEIPLYVELSHKEQVLYEALRQDAIQKLSDQDAQAEAGTKHLRVLAEIMRLRRCCCNPELVAPPEAQPGICSKLDLFGETLEELLSNHHKALVFSQFVDHLAILRRYLDEQGISYQYLDGSTSAKQRKTRVDAFQAGEGDVFLISLKAGGTGLNLTAADYVIHMDPWWNPAVEDQASDRAHRIGQKRPVTIYRLITRNTIEEKIVDLHRQKRDLADSLLEGADMSGKISTDELLRLIRE